MSDTWFDKNIVAFVDGELSNDDLQKFEEQIKKDPTLQKDVEEHQSVARLITYTSTPETSDELSLARMKKRFITAAIKELKGANHSISSISSPLEKMSREHLKVPSTKNIHDPSKKIRWLPYIGVSGIAASLLVFGFISMETFNPPDISDTGAQNLFIGLPTIKDSAGPLKVLPRNPGGDLTTKLGWDAVRSSKIILKDSETECKYNSITQMVQCGGSTEKISVDTDGFGLGIAYLIPSFTDVPGILENLPFQLEILSPITGKLDIFETTDPELETLVETNIDVIKGKSVKLPSVDAFTVTDIEKITFKFIFTSSDKRIEKTKTFKVFYNK